jgi:hypothetical protein
MNPAPTTPDEQSLAERRSSHRRDQLVHPELDAVERARGDSPRPDVDRLGAAPRSRLDDARQARGVVQQGSPRPSSTSLGP